MKWMIIIPFFLFTSCLFLGASLRIDHNKVKQITILDRRDSASIVISDSVLIEQLLENCLNGSRREPWKFVPTYQLDIKEVDASYVVYVNDRHINRSGATYTSSCNVEATIKALFK